MTTGRETWAGSGAAGHLPQGIIYPELVHSGMTETLQQNTDAFNAATRNAIRMVPVRSQGDFKQESMFKNVANLVQRRDVSSTSPGNDDVSSEDLPIDEHISVKLNRRIGPVDVTMDAFRKLSGDGSFNADVASFVLGQQAAKALMVDQLESGLTSARAAIANQAAVTIDYGATASPQSNLSTDRLVDLLALFGDAAGKIVMWVMHSKSYYDLVREQIAAKLTNVSDFNIATAMPITLNRPVLVTDSAALTSVGASPEQTQYHVLGLTADGLVLEESEETFVQTDVVTGKQNLVFRSQGETAYNVKVKGFRYDPANGGVNPDDTVLATGSNWDPIMDSHKDFAGVQLTVL